MYNSFIGWEKKSWGDIAVKVRQTFQDIVLSCLAVISPFFSLKTYCYAKQFKKNSP